MASRLFSCYIPVAILLVPISSSLASSQECPTPSFINSNNNDPSLTCSCNTGYQGTVGYFNETLWDSSIQTFPSGCTLNCISINGYCPPSSFPFNSSNWFNRMTYFQGNPKGFNASSIKNASLTSQTITEVQLTSLSSSTNDYNAFYTSSRIQDLNSFIFEFEFYSAASSCYTNVKNVTSNCVIAGNLIFFIGASEPLLVRDKSGTLNNENDDPSTSIIVNFDTWDWAHSKVYYHPGTVLLKYNNDFNTRNGYFQDASSDSVTTNWIGASKWYKASIKYTKGNGHTWVVTLDDGINGPIVVLDYSDFNNANWLTSSGSLYGISAASYSKDNNGNILQPNDFRIRNVRFKKLGNVPCNSNLDCINGNEACIQGACSLIPCTISAPYTGSPGQCICDSGFYGNVSYSDHTLNGCEACPFNTSSLIGSNTNSTSCSYENWALNLLSTFSKTSSGQTVAMHSIARLVTNSSFSHIFNPFTSPCSLLPTFILCEVDPTFKQTLITSMRLSDINSISLGKK